jgi:hypothetical protein
MVIRIFVKSRELVMFDDDDDKEPLCIMSGILLFSCLFFLVFSYCGRINQVQLKSQEMKKSILIDRTAKILSKDVGFFELGYQVKLKSSIIGTKKIFVNVDDYVRLKPSDTVCVQYSQLDGKNKDFQLCPKK